MNYHFVVFKLSFFSFLLCEHSLLYFSAPKCRLVAAQFSNSAYHGAALDRKHIGSELRRFLREVEASHGISLEMVAKQGVYLSHETCTHASPSSSCAANEVCTTNEKKRTKKRALHTCFLGVINYIYF
jgi:hypothetical protein